MRPEHLTMLLSRLTEETRETPRIENNAGLLTVVLDVREMSLKEQPIEKIVMIANTKKTIHPGKPFLNSTSRIIFQLVSGELRVFQFQPHCKAVDQVDTFYLLLTWGGECRNLFNEYGTGVDKSWHFLGTQETYTPEIKEYYMSLHETMSQYIVRAIKTNPNMHKKAATQGIQAISLGCGEGADLLAFYKALLAARFDNAPFEGAKFNCQMQGVDLYEREVKRAIDTKPKRFNFTQHDLTQIETLTPKLGLEPNTLKIIISSGSLTREVMSGAYAVAQVLQKTHSYLQADLIIIGGFTHVILSPEIATDIGYRAESIILPGGRAIYLLHNQALDTQIQHVERKSLSRSHSGNFTILDLSLSAMPLILSNAFLPTAKKDLINTIDLSWAHLREDEIPAMIACLQQFPVLKNIIISDCEPWARSFMEQVKLLKKYTLYKRQDCTNPLELPTLSVPFARALNLYEGLPVQIVFQPQSTAGEAPAAFFSHGHATSITERVRETTDYAPQLKR